MKKNSLVFSFLFVIALFILWEICGLSTAWPHSLIPTPSAIVRALFEQFPLYFFAFISTLKISLFGFFLSSILGIGVGILLTFSTWLRQAILPLAVFFQTVPIIAIAPLLVIYFGYGEPPIIAAAAFVSFFPILAGTVIGLESVSSEDLLLLRVYTKSTLKELCYIRLPRSYPFLYSSLRVSSGLSVIGTVAGEFVAGGGLGAIIDSARTQQNVAMVFVALLLLVLIGFILLLGLGFIDKILCYQRPFRFEN